MGFYRIFRYIYTYKCFQFSGLLTLIYVHHAYYIINYETKTKISFIIDSQSVIKRKVDLDAVSLEDCVKKFPPAINVNQNSIICAGSKEGKDSCKGDSGGPLLKEISEDGQVNWYLYGITSFGPRKCGEGIPAAYTRVTSFMDWIKSNIAPR